MSKYILKITLKCNNVTEYLTNRGGSKMVKGGNKAIREKFIEFRGIGKYEKETSSNFA